MEAHPDPRFPRWFEQIWGKYKIGRMELRHEVEEGARNVVRSWEGPEIDDKAPSSIGDEVFEAALADSKNFRGVQKYGVYAFSTDQSRIAQVGRTYVQIEGGLSEEVNEFTSQGNEPANMRGHLSQMMRHNESFAKISIVGARENSAMMQKIIFQQQQTIEKMAERELKIMELTQTLMDRSAERTIELEDKQDSRQMKKALINKGLEMAPVFMSKLLSNGAKNPADEQIKGLLTHFASTLNEEQMMNLMGVLDDGQKAVFIELYTTLQRQAEEQRQAQEAMAVQVTETQPTTDTQTQTKETPP